MASDDAVADLVRIAARLRAPGGCPWDREQTHASLRPYVLEEAFEVAEAIDADDPDRLRDELGDLLFQTVIHAQLASEEGRFDLDDVARRMSEKLVRRHPHVFAGQEIAGGDLLGQWERIKREERSGEPAAPADTERLAELLYELADIARRRGADAAAALRSAAERIERGEAV